MENEEEEEEEEDSSPSDESLDVVHDLKLYQGLKAAFDEAGEEVGQQAYVHNCYDSFVNF